MTDPLSAPPPGPDAMRTAARKLEAQVLQEFLRAARVGEAPEGFGGGEGEEQFASFMREAVAEQMVARGGTGLAETIFRAMTGARRD